VLLSLIAVTFGLAIFTKQHKCPTITFKYCARNKFVLLVECLMFREAHAVMYLYNEIVNHFNTSGILCVCIGVDSQYMVTIVSNPAGVPVSGSNNTFDYPILSNVTLTCMVDPSPPADATYQWDTTGCFTNERHSTPTCFPGDKTTQNITDTDLLAEDAGIIMCTATINNTGYDSRPFTLRISGIHTSIVNWY